MRIGQVARTPADPPRATRCSSAPTSSPGLQSVKTKSTLVYCDNVSAVYLSTNPIQHQHTKHVEIDLHFVRKRVAIGDVRVLHVPTTSQFADIFTKGLPTSVFSEFRSSLNIRSG
jgi:hypothetical protein